MSRSFEDAIKIAKGCKDYLGGYRGDELEAFHQGIQTVVNALEAAAKNNPNDLQVANLMRTGEQITESEKVNNNPSDKKDSVDSGANHLVDTLMDVGREMPDSEYSPNNQTTEGNSTVLGIPPEKLQTVVFTEDGIIDASNAMDSVSSSEKISEDISDSDLEALNEFLSREEKEKNIKDKVITTTYNWSMSLKQGDFVKIFNLSETIKEKAKIDRVTNNSIWVSGIEYSITKGCRSVNHNEIWEMTFIAPINEKAADTEL